MKQDEDEDVTETTTTTANVATFQIPVGTRIDDFIKRYGKGSEDDDRKAGRNPAVLSRVFPTS